MLLSRFGWCEGWDVMLVGMSLKRKIDAWVCQRCDHVWVPHATTVKPTTCPKCRSAYWDRPRRIKKKGKE